MKWKRKVAKRMTKRPEILGENMSENQYIEIGNKVTGNEARKKQDVAHALERNRHYNCILFIEFL